MRTALIALFAVVGFGTGVAVADELKAPACETKMRGVMWNFGSDQSPDIRRCDGISYVPFSAGVGGGVLPAPMSEAQHHSCEGVCEAKRLVCERECSFLQPNCKEDCRRRKAECSTSQCR